MCKGTIDNCKTGKCCGGCKRPAPVSYVTPVTNGGSPLRKKEIKLLGIVCVVFLVTLCAAAIG